MSEVVCQCLGGLHWSSGLRGASEQVDAIRDLYVVAARGAVAPPLRHPAGGLLSGLAERGCLGSVDGFPFNGRRLWYTMAVALVVIVVIRYALGRFSEAPTPAASAIGASTTEGASGGVFLVRKAEISLVARLVGERT
jgi:hypothetical protein